MKRYACMLRGVNVSGQRKLTMKELVRACTAAGFSEVESYLQSGNLILSSPLPADKVEDLLQETICNEFGYSDVDVLAWTAKDIAAAINGIPEGWREYDTAKLHFSFVKETSLDGPRASMQPADYLPDELALGKNVAYVHCPNGYGRTKLNNSFVERYLNTRATTRNWNTTTKLYELASR